jgi:hypothetical protein
MQGRYAVGKIKNAALREVIYAYPPRLLVAELRELAKRSEFKVPLDMWPQPRPERLRKTRDGRIMVEWRFLIKAQEIVDLICDHYGMLPGTWKAKAFEERVRFYKEHRGHKLTSSGRRKLREIKKRYPWDVPMEWMESKLLEYFGES